MPSQFPQKDAELADWGVNFAAECAANALVLGLDPGDLEAISEAGDAFAARYREAENAKRALLGAIATKDEQKAAMLALFRTFVRQFAANPNVDADVLSALGLKVEPTRAGPVRPPTRLVVVGTDNGTNRLKWDRNGNSERVVFVIEARVGSSPTWEFVDVTTKTRYADEGRTPGVRTEYRVFAKRAGFQSAPSGSAVVYASSLLLAA